MPMRLKQYNKLFHQISLSLLTLSNPLLLLASAPARIFVYVLVTLLSINARYASGCIDEKVD